MFGKPEWFREKKNGWGLSPVSWQGWAYGIGWMAAIAVPAAVVLASTGALQSLLWVAASGGLLLWDVVQLKQAGRAAKIQPAEDVLFIGDEENDRLATRRYEMRVRT